MTRRTIGTVRTCWRTRWRARPRARRPRIGPSAPARPAPRSAVRTGRPRSGIGANTTRTGELIVQEEVPAEAELVRELYARLLAGHSFKAIARDWETRGARTRSGKVWTPEHLRTLVLSPSYAGLRGHIAGREGGKHPAYKASQLFEGIWKGLVSREDWHAVQNLVSKPERRKSRSNRAKHLMSTIARVRGVRRGDGDQLPRGTGRVRLPQGWVRADRQSGS